MSLFFSDHNSVLFVRLVHLVDRVNEASVSETQVLLHGEVPVFLHGRAHDFVEARVDNIQLRGTFDLLTLLRLVAHDLKQTHLGLLFVLLGHLTGGDVFKVLKPLEVGAGDTTSVDQKIGSANNTLAREDLLGSEGSGTVGTLEDCLNFNVIGVALVERLLNGGGNQVIGLLLYEGKRVSNFGFHSTRETLECTFFG